MAWLGPITIAPVVIVPIAPWLLVVPSHGAYWTTTGVVAIGFAFLALVIGLLKWISRRYPPWDATDSLGFGRRTPWLALLGVTWVVASILNTDGVYHDARVSTDLGPSAPRYTDLKSAFDTWLGAQDQCAGAAGQVPMVLVAASGGGIRAAYWTAVTLDALFGSQRGKCPALRLFAVSGVSGGSVGATAWVAAMAAGKRGTGVVKEMSKDHGLAAAAAGLLLRDLIQPFTGITTWRDRAALLEDGWTESVGGIFDPAKSPLKWSAVGNGHGLAWVPLLVLNASSVTDGCRVLVANVGALPAATGGDCGASPLGQRPAGPVSASIDPFPGLHERTDTNAAKWNSLGTGMRAVTAALLSARFPIISPSGALLRWVPDTPSSKGGNQVANKSQVITYDVDGGYYENSGLLTLLQIWAAIDPLVREHNQSTRANDHPISPWIVVVDNHYRSNAKAAQPRRPLELVAPLSALSNNRILGQTALEQTAALAVRAEGDRVSPGPKTTGGMVVIAPTMEPSVAAPLGWVLSETSRSDMNNQFKARHLLNESPGASGLRELLRQLDSWGNS